VCQDELEKLNRIVWPAIRKLIQEEILRAANNGDVSHINQLPYTKYHASICTQSFILLVKVTVSFELGYCGFIRSYCLMLLQ